jgi:hypothetical protein
VLVVRGDAQRGHLCGGGDLRGGPHPERRRCSLSGVMRSVDTCAAVKLGTKTCLQNAA